MLKSLVYAQGPIIIAHSGTSWDTPQNTMPAFTLARKSMSIKDTARDSDKQPKSSNINLSTVK